MKHIETSVSKRIETCSDSQYSDPETKAAAKQVLKALKSTDVYSSLKFKGGDADFLKTVSTWNSYGMNTAKASIKGAAGLIFSIGLISKPNEPMRCIVRIRPKLKQGYSGNVLASASFPLNIAASSLSKRIVSLIEKSKLGPQVRETTPIAKSRDRVLTKDEVSLIAALNAASKFSQGVRCTADGRIWIKFWRKTNYHIGSWTTIPDSDDLDAPRKPEVPVGTVAKNIMKGILDYTDGVVDYMKPYKEAVGKLTGKTAIQAIKAYPAFRPTITRLTRPKRA